MLSSEADNVTIDCQMFAFPRASIESELKAAAAGAVAPGTSSRPALLEL